MKKRTKQWDSDDTYGSDIIGVGSYCIWRETVKGRPKQDKKIVGFVRPKIQQKARQK